MKEADLIQEGKVRDTIIDFLITIPLFDKLKADELKIIVKRMNFVELDKGEILFKEGDKGDYMCFIIDGTLDVVKESAAGEGIVITALSKGRSIGEMSVIDDFSRSATVKVRTEAKLVILTQGNFELILEEHPKIGIKILKRISRLLSLNMRKTSSRLADYMLPLS